MIYQPPLPFNGDIFDDAEEVSEMVAKDSSSGVDVSGSNTTCSNISDEHEDWDKEIEQSWQPYPITRRKCADDGKTTLVDEIQQLISSYPPAAQACTGSAAYKSVVFDNLDEPIRETDAVVFASEEGQFDDADS